MTETVTAAASSNMCAMRRDIECRLTKLLTVSERGGAGGVK